MLAKALRAKEITRGVVRRLARRGRKSAVAVEWSGEWLKAAQVEINPAGGPDGKRLVRIDARRIPSVEELPNLLRDLIADWMKGADSVVVSLPRNLVTVRNLKLPSIDPAEIKDMIALQVTRQTPYSKEEIISNFQTVRSSAAEGMTHVIVVIAHREVSHERVRVLKSARLKGGGIRISSEGIMRWRRIDRDRSEAGPVAIVDIDAQYTDFLVISGERLAFTKVMPIGAGKIADDPERWLAKFSAEMKSAVDLYEHEGVGDPITRIVVTGAAIEPIGLEESIEEKFGLTVERVSLFGPIPQPPQIPPDLEIPWKTLSFTAVTGLAWDPMLAGIDLVPSEVTLQEGLAKRGRDLMLMGGLFLSILTILSAVVSERLYFKREYLEQLRAEVQKTQDQAAEVEKLSKKIKILREARRVQNSSIEVLSLLHRLIPPEIHFTAITFKGEQLTLSGVSQEMSDVFKFVSVLDKQRGFENVKIKQVTKRAAEGERERTDFEIACVLTTKNEDHKVVSF